jgi:hypothetical protein
MAKPKIAEIRIRPKKGGGHTVTHEFAPSAQYSAGKNGGMSMSAPAPEEHHFAAGEHNALLQHIAGALALKSMAQGQGQPTSAPSPGAALGAGMPPQVG